MKELLRSTTAYKSVLSDAKRAAAVHAALIVFPDERYLRALLKECAKALFCAEDGSRTERLIGEEHLPDCMIFPAAGGKLTVDTGAYILEESALRPVEGDKKLFILDAFHTAPALVQNKLLKILEEPPAGVYFLLGAVNEYAVLPTVLSRVKKYTVPPFPEEQIEAALRRNHPLEKGIREAAGACGGIYSTAEDLLTGGGELFARAEQFLSGEDTETFCRSLTEREEAKSFFAAVRLVLRDVLFAGQGREKYAARTGAGISKLVTLYPAGAAISALALVDEAERQMTFNANYSQCALALALGLDKERKKWQRLHS